MVWSRNSGKRPIMSEFNGESWMPYVLGSKLVLSPEAWIGSWLKMT